MKIRVVADHSGPALNKSVPFNLIGFDGCLAAAARLKVHNAAVSNHDVLIALAAQAVTKVDIIVLDRKSGLIKAARLPKELSADHETGTRDSSNPMNTGVATK